MEGDVIVGQRQTLFVHAGVRAAVHHQSHINVPEAAVFPHGHLGAEGFLCGSAVNHQLEGLVDTGVFQRHGGTAYAGTLHMVAAAVAKIPQGIVFAQQTDPGTALALLPGCPESGGPVLQAPLYGKAVFFQIVLQQSGGKELLAVVFGIVKDLIGHGKQPIRLGLYKAIQFFFHENPPEWIPSPKDRRGYLCFCLILFRVCPQPQWLGRRRR